MSPPRPSLVLVLLCGIGATSAGVFGAGRGSLIGPLVPFCARIPCADDCHTDCGWSKKYDSCIPGAKTSQSELGLGDCSATGRATAATTDTGISPPAVAATSPSPLPASDACKAVLCANDCRSPCGWSTNKGLCVKGGKTKKRELGMGQCSPVRENTRGTGIVSTDCGAQVCAVLCRGACGWSKKKGRCVEGGYTSSAEVGMGVCFVVGPNSTKPTSPASTLPRGTPPPKRRLVAAAAPPKAVVLVVADDQGWNDVGFTGANHFRTPTLDGLAERGLMVINHYALQFCAPTRYALHSGRYPLRFGLQWTNARPFTETSLPLEELTLAQELQAAGWATHLVGKWHLGALDWDMTPTRRGFDSHFGMLYGSGDYWGYNRTAADKCRGIDAREDTVDTKRSREDLVGTYKTDAFSAAAEAVVDGHDFDARPLFLMIAYSAPHSPFQAPQDVVESFRAMYPERGRRTVAAMMSVMDTGIGRVQRALESRSAWAETLFIYFSDNGGAGPEESNYPLRGEKKTLWEGGVRTLAVVHGDAFLPQSSRGATTNHLFHVTDWYPTILSAAGVVSAKPHLDGVDQWGALTSSASTEQAAGPRQEVVVNTYQCNENGIRACGAIRIGDYKYAVGVKAFKGGKWHMPDVAAAAAGVVRCGVAAVAPEDRARECQNDPCLFNLETDPCELNNLAAQMPERVASMAEALGNWVAVTAATQPVVSVSLRPCTGGNRPIDDNGVWRPRESDDRTKSEK